MNGSNFVYSYTLQEGVEAPFYTVSYIPSFVINLLPIEKTSLEQCVFYIRCGCIEDEYKFIISNLDLSYDEPKLILSQIGVVFEYSINSIKQQIDITKNTKVLLNNEEISVLSLFPVLRDYENNYLSVSNEISQFDFLNLSLTVKEVFHSYSNAIHKIKQKAEQKEFGYSSIVSIKDGCEMLTITGVPVKKLEYVEDNKSIDFILYEQSQSEEV